MDEVPTDPLPLPGPEPWSRSDRASARMFARPLRAFLGIEAAGGAVLLVATVAALVWANSPWQASYTTVFDTEIVLSVGSHALRGDVTHWVNDGLMTVFFLVVGMEIKREWVAGELRDRRAAALPAFAALGGMIVPALLYLAVSSGAGRRGWGIPMATDIAFALGIVAVLGRRVPAPLKVFLLTLAVVDDIGAIVVIAVFYAGALSWGWLAAAVVVVGAVVVLQRAGVRYLPAFVALGVALWLCLYESGVHATLAGVVMGLLTPALPLLPDLRAGHVVEGLPAAPDRSAGAVRDVRFLVRESVSPAERITHALHPWSAFVVVPVFALANAGIEVTGSSLTSPSSVTVAVVVGLVVGKAVGISLFSWLAVRLGFGALSPGVRWVHVVGVAAIGGVGFTVSLFVAGLAFPPSSALVDEAKIGILVGSVVAAALGSAVLATAGSRRDP